MNYKWCLDWKEEENNYQACLKWVCQCGHSFKGHSTEPPHECLGLGCTCEKEIYANNDFCDIECQILYKIKENETC